MKISQLPPKLKQLALANMSEPDEKKKLLHAFSWRVSNEGLEFWETVYSLSKCNKLAKLYPNDAELGGVIRQLSNQ